MASPLLTVFVTCTSKKEAEVIASAVVKEKLAACANFFPISSRYIWNGQFTKSTEYALLLKTPRRLFAKLSARIKKLHSYSLPAIVAWEDAAVDAQYHSWVLHACKNR